MAMNMALVAVIQVSCKLSEQLMLNVWHARQGCGFSYFLLIKPLPTK